MQRHKVGASAGSQHHVKLGCCVVGLFLKGAPAGEATSCQASHHAGCQHSLSCLCLGLCPPEALLGGGSLSRGASCCSCSR